MIVWMVAFASAFGAEPTTPSPGTPKLDVYAPLDVRKDLPAAPTCSTDPREVLDRVRPYVDVLAREAPDDGLDAVVHWGAATSWCRGNFQDPTGIPEDPRAFAAGVRARLAGLEFPLVDPTKRAWVREHVWLRPLEDASRGAYAWLPGSPRGHVVLMCLDDGQWWIVGHESQW